MGVSGERARRWVSTENSAWGAPRVHGELLILGFDVSERTISRWMRKAPRNPEPAKRWMLFEFSVLLRSPSPVRCTKRHSKLRTIPLPFRRILGRVSVSFSANSGPLIPGITQKQMDSTLALLTYLHGLGSAVRLQHGIAAV